jgi:hypothetical protein
MSVPVDLGDLAAAMQRYGWAYLLTVNDDDRPHSVAVSPAWDGDELVVAGGRRTTTNVATRPKVSLCFPPADPDDYSLIVDADGAVTAGEIRLSPTAAVLHRPPTPGAPASPTGCASDCRPVTGSSR